MNYLIIIGLVLDIVGAGLVWKYGVTDATAAYVKAWAIEPSLDEKDEAARVTTLKKDRHRSRQGLGCLTLGFALQLIANLCGK